MNQAEKDRVAKGKRTLIKTFSDAYEEDLRKQAQAAAPNLLGKLITMAEGTKYERDEDGVILRDEDYQAITNGPLIPLQLQRGAINDVLDHAKPPPESAAIPPGGGGAIGGGARFYIKEIHFAPQADTPESVLANATVVEAVAAEVVSAAGAVTADEEQPPCAQEED